MTNEEKRSHLHRACWHRAHAWRKAGWLLNQSHFQAVSSSFTDFLFRSDERLLQLLYVVFDNQDLEVLFRNVCSDQRFVSHWSG